MDLDKKTLARTILEACEHESLNYRQAGKFLNIASPTFSLIKKEVSYVLVSPRYWDRIAEWAQTRQKISAFMIPEGEEILGQYQENQPAADQPHQVTDAPAGITDKTVSAPTVQPDKSSRPIKENTRAKPQKASPDQEQIFTPPPSEGFSHDRSRHLCQWPGNHFEIAA